MAKEEITDEVLEETLGAEDSAVELDEKAPEVDPNSPEAQLSALHASRMGNFKVQAAYSELKYFKNMLNKVEWTGSNEAYLVALSCASLDSTLNSLDSSKVERIEVELPAAVIEALNYFLGKVTGKGRDGANKLFSATMLLRQAVLAITKLQEEIHALDSEIKTAKKAK